MIFFSTDLETLDWSNDHVQIFEFFVSFLFFFFKSYIDQMTIYISLIFSFISNFCIGDLHSLISFVLFMYSSVHETFLIFFYTSFNFIINIFFSSFIYWFVIYLTSWRVFFNLNNIKYSFDFYAIFHAALQQSENLENHFFPLKIHWSNIVCSSVSPILQSKIFFRKKNVFPERKFYQPARLHQWLLNIKVQTISYRYVDLGQFPSHYDWKLEMGQSL